MPQRSPYDGLPYYCRLCGMGWAEYQACEAGDCELESEATALGRQKRPAALRREKRAADLVPGDSVFMHDNSLRVVKEVDHGKGLIPKGREADERSVVVHWVEGGFSTVLRTGECLVAE